MVVTSLDAHAAFAVRQTMTAADAEPERRDGLARDVAAERREAEARREVRCAADRVVDRGGSHVHREATTRDGHDAEVTVDLVLVRLVAEAEPEPRTDAA